MPLIAAKRTLRRSSLVGGNEAQNNPVADEFPVELQWRGKTSA
jgi:hypothetical protein